MPRSNIVRYEYVTPLVVLLLRYRDFPLQKFLGEPTMVRHIASLAIRRKCPKQIRETQVYERELMGKAS